MENSVSCFLVECGLVMGMMKIKDEEFDCFFKEWEMDYKDVKYKYRELYICVEMIKVVIDDFV